MPEFPVDIAAAKAAARRRPTGGAAVAVAFAFWITMAGTTAPTPLYPLYGRAFAFSPITVTVVFAVYAVGVVAGLLLFGRLSDQIGRRPTLLIATALSLVAAAIFLLAQSVTVLLLARVVSGFSAALVTGAATAALAELIGPDARVRPATIALFANMGGLACGTLLAGILADLAPAPLRTPWWVIGVLALLGLLGVATSRESATHRSGFTWQVQPLHIPGEIRAEFLRSGMAAGAGFAVLGVLTAVTGLFLSTLLHQSSHALTGLVVFIAFACTALGQLLVRAVKSAVALPAACLGLTTAAALIAAALATTSLLPLLAGAAVNGLATGVALGHGVGAITTRSAPQYRGASVSTFFAILYAMLAVPAIGVGVLIHLWSLAPTGQIFSLVVGVLAMGVLLSLRGARTKR
ncbi:MFS transporter [Nonomuraea muscovyensis]|uniref:Putative MFS family arabinose efflux permease n=1 Tax=Nonomuraea muscovyensis TaxID=1124761 RepID=A0A7X0BXQ5_9ACTN|nr:MFS transporter [Nonomuraea muscovyensis]MBB6344543.1 putative MFS family arabinose efflux permease [Nonomuraea muscovyensis]